MNLVEKQSNYLLNNPIIYGLLALLLSIYGPRLHPKLPNIFRDLFNNNIFRFSIILLIIFISSSDLKMSLIVAIGFLLLTSFSSNQSADDIIDEENPENYSNLDLIKEFYSEDTDQEGPETEPSDIDENFGENEDEDEEFEESPDEDDNVQEEEMFMNQNDKEMVDGEEEMFMDQKEEEIDDEEQEMFMDQKEEEMDDEEQEMFMDKNDQEMDDEEFEESPDEDDNAKEEEMDDEEENFLIKPRGFSSNNTFNQLSKYSAIENFKQSNQQSKIKNIVNSYKFGI